MVQIMRLHIIAVGKKKSEYDTMIQEYYKRIIAPFELSFTIVSESEKIQKGVQPHDFVIALDELGKAYTTKEFSVFLGKQLHTSIKRIVFIIGDSYGLDENTRKRADLTLCLGTFTLPHELARLVLVEQLYRTTNLLSGGKYHHP